VKAFSAGAALIGFSFLCILALRIPKEAAASAPQASAS
jgi:hypothetical protein